MGMAAEEERAVHQFLVPGLPEVGRATGPMRTPIAVAAGVEAWLVPPMRVGMVAVA